VIDLRSRTRTLRPSHTRPTDRVGDDRRRSTDRSTFLDKRLVDDGVGVAVAAVADAAELVAVVTDAHAYCLHLSHVLSRTNASYDDRHDDDDDDGG
jgi:hypothetical protein